MLAQAESGPKLSNLAEGEHLNQSLVNKHLVLIAQGEQAVRLIIEEAKNGNLRGSVSGLVIGIQGAVYVSLN